VMMGVRTSFGQVMQAILADLARFVARLIAIKVLLAIIKGATGGASAAASSGSTKVVENVGYPSAQQPLPVGAGGAVMRAQQAGEAQQITINNTINAIDARSVADQFRSRAGSFARYNDRSAILARA